MRHTDDKELLEKAAKAAGIELLSWSEISGAYRTTKPMLHWNPLTDAGDALRLAVDLDIEFYQANDEGRASYAGYWGKPERRDVTRMFCIEYHDDLLHKGDSYAATRRAIVRAAAAIGEGMK